MASSEHLSQISPDLLHIRLLSDQLDQLYMVIQQERSQLAAWEEAQEFSILGVMELYATEVQGYAEQVQMNCLQSASEAVANLRRLNVFGIDYFADWYFGYRSYSGLKQYIDQLDHLRLLLLEYCRQQASVAA